MCKKHEPFAEQKVSFRVIAGHQFIISGEDDVSELLNYALKKLFKAKPHQSIKMVVAFPELNSQVSTIYITMV